MNDQEVRDLRSEVWKSFVAEQHIYLATADGDQPRVRPVTLIRLRDRLLVATGSNDAKVKQMKENPLVEFCLLLEKEGEKGTVRAECSASIVEDKEVKAEIYDRVAFMKEFFESPGDPGYTLIELRPNVFEVMRPGSIQAEKVAL